MYALNTFIIYTNKIIVYTLYNLNKKYTHGYFLIRCSIFSPPDSDQNINIKIFWTRYRNRITGLYNNISKCHYRFEIFSYFHGEILIKHLICANLPKYNQTLMNIEKVVSFSKSGPFRIIVVLNSFSIPFSFWFSKFKLRYLEAFVQI